MMYSISFIFDEKKATQAACLLLALNGGRMNYMKLIKLLYLADRKYILEYNNSITTDRYVSINNGPVTSQIYDLIKESQTDSGTFWASYIRTQNHDVVLLKKIPEDGYDCLSLMEMEVITEINNNFSDLSEWDIVDFCHKELKEWQNPLGSSIPISIEDIVRVEKDGNAACESIEELGIAAKIQKHNYAFNKEGNL